MWSRASSLSHVLAGMPCVFWDHLFQYPQQIKDLIALRREADLHARSNVVINIAESDVYIATIDDKCVFSRDPPPLCTMRSESLS